MQAIPHWHRPAQARPEGSIYPAAPESEHGRLLRRVAGTDIPVLVRGLPDSGRRWLARSLHALGGGGPLLEIESLPAVGGSAPTGCAAERLFALARRAAGGSLLVADVACLSSRAQAALGELIDRPQFAVRVIGCASVSPDGDRALGLRRRLIDSFLHVELPPLCDRAGDLAAVVRLHVACRAEVRGRSAPPVPPRLLERLAACGWPGSLAQVDRFARQTVRDGHVRGAVRSALRQGPDRVSVDGIPRAVSSPPVERGRVVPFAGREKVFRSDGSGVPRIGPLRVPRPEPF